jgi:hypothetical protein
MQSQKLIKWYKIIRRGADPIYIEQDRLAMIMNDPQQLIKFYEESGEWRVFNKADVVDAFYDKEYSLKKNEQEYDLYKNKKTNTVLKLLKGQLLDNNELYEKL